MPSNGDGLTPRRRSPRDRALDAVTPHALKMPVGHHDYTVSQAVRVPMRDGVALLTDVYADRDVVGDGAIRTPFGRAGTVARLSARYYATHGYRVVNQSCRGTDGSGGEFEPFRREVDDGADTVAWLREQPWFDGRFALCGASYLDFTAWALMVDPPPELAAAVTAISAHDNHWVSHGAEAFALEGR